MCRSNGSNMNQSSSLRNGPSLAGGEMRLHLQQAGLKITAARLAILQQLSEALSPLTHAELMQGLPATLSTDRSTVFRVLQDFVEHGLAKRMDLGDHIWRYALGCSARVDAALESAGHDHPHLVCIDCGNVRCLTADEVELNIAGSIGAIQEVVLRGRCAPCCTLHAASGDSCQASAER